MKASTVNLLIAIFFIGLFAIYVITGSQFSQFLFGLGLLALFIWYFATDLPRRKRIIGGVLTVLLAATCVEALWPRKLNVSEERVKLEALDSAKVTEVRDALAEVVTENGFTKDSSDERTEFPGKEEGSFNADTKAAYKKTYDGGVGRVYFIDGDMKGEAAEGKQWVHVFNFWDPDPPEKKGMPPAPRPADLDEVWQSLIEASSGYDNSPKQVPILYGIDLAGGSSFKVRIDRPEGQEAIHGEIDQVIGTLSDRLNAFGGKDLLIAPQGTDRMLVQMPGIDDEQRDSIKKTLTAPSQLSLHIVDSAIQVDAPGVASGEKISPGRQAYPSKDPDDGTGGYYLLSRTPDLPGTHVQQSWATIGNTNAWSIMVDFDGEGSKLFGELTTKNKGKQMAIVLDGEVLSAPVIQGPIYGTCEISGQFSENEARSLAASLQNPLRNPLVIESESSVDPALGKAAISQGFIAAIAGLILTLVFVLIYYRFAGIISLVGLIVTMLFLVGSLAMFQFTLTLPGIAGIILTIGIAIDANVLIYERLKEEIGDGRSLPMAINAGYNKAFSAIFDANITSLITAFILYFVASGPVKGFAVTLIVGILGSMFAALIVTRVIFNWGTDAGWLKKLAFWEFIPQKNIDFLGKRGKALIISLVLIGAALLGMGVRNFNALGVDFRGGHMFTLKVTNDSINVESVQDALGGLDLPEAPIVQGQTTAIGNDRYVTVRMVSKEDEAEANQQVEEVKALLKENLNLEEGAAIQTESVGSAVGKQLAFWSIMAMALGMVGILLYVTLRFEFAFALGAIVAVIHDILITLGIVILTGREISLVLVGAFLTIAGYSINDTIVVFDRIREGLKTKRGELEDVMNQSISETLRRTILTSMTTLVALLTLFIFGGPALRDFSFTIIIGVLIGTYSSIFVASPIVYWWAKRRNLNLRKEILDAEQRLDTPDRYQED